MLRSLHCPAALCLASLFLATAPPAAPQAGVDREAMWYAPTAEDWAKPCLITWQRSFEDAIEVARAEQRPILIAVNMDGEIASEHYAGVRYRSPEIAALYEPYVCVIASTYRHTPADHDEHGERIECPRFGGVTCGEHIAIEPGLHDLFFDGQRVAPRHIGIELTEAGELPGPEAEYYDVYYALDTDSVFEAVRAGSVGRVPEDPPARGERPVLEHVASADVRDRRAVERAFAEGETATRRALLERAVAAGERAPTELLRMAIFGLDADLARIARAALAESAQPGAPELIAEALRTAASAEEREALLTALERLAPGSDRARNLAIVHRGLGAGRGAIDLSSWGGASYSAAPDSAATITDRTSERALAARTAPADPEASLAFAEASLQTALDPRTAALFTDKSRGALPMRELLLEDARRALATAVELGQTGWRVDAATALLDYYTGNPEAAYPRAEAAFEALPGGAPSAGEETASWTAAALAQVFAEARERRIIASVRAKRPWPPEWLADVDAAYTVLAQRELDSDHDVQVHHDFLRWLGADERAEQVLDSGLERYAASPVLHERLRQRSLRRGGAQALLEVYEPLVAGDTEDGRMAWFAGFAARSAAEFQRRRGRPADAHASYTRSIELFERDIVRFPEERASADHEIALALAGAARVELEAGDLAAATHGLLTALTRSPASGATLDGLNVSPVMTANTLRARLLESGDEAGAARVLTALQQLDPVLLEPPAFEPRGTGRRPR